jgi:hypothetical protein
MPSWTALNCAGVIECDACSASSSFTALLTPATMSTMIRKKITNSARST